MKLKKKDKVKVMNVNELNKILIMYGIYPDQLAKEQLEVVLNTRETRKLFIEIFGEYATNDIYDNGIRPILCNIPDTIRSKSHKKIKENHLNYSPLFWYEKKRVIIVDSLNVIKL